MSLPTPLTPADRFAQIIAMMVGMIGARLERPGKPGLAGPLTFAIHLRLQGIRNRITRYVARFRAGQLTPPRPRPATPRGRTVPAKPVSAKPPRWAWANLPKLPRGRMWLTRLVPGIGVGANHLQGLLEDPEMRAMLAAAPQIGRTLRPFWHMLSDQPYPKLLQPPPRPVDRPRGAPAKSGEGRKRRFLSPRPLAGNGGGLGPDRGETGERAANPRHHPRAPHRPEADADHDLPPGCGPPVPA